MAVLVLKTACEVQIATQELAERVASYVRRLENDPGAKFEGEAWGGEDSSKVSRDTLGPGMNAPG